MITSKTSGARDIWVPAISFVYQVLNTEHGIGTPEVNKYFISSPVSEFGSNLGFGLTQFVLIDCLFVVFRPRNIYGSIRTGTDL